MGTKFANLHIQTQDQQLVLDALRQLTDQAGHVLVKPILNESNILDQYIFIVKKAETPSGRLSRM